MNVFCFIKLRSVYWHLIKTVMLQCRCRLINTAAKTLSKSHDRLMQLPIFDVIKVRQCYLSFTKKRISRDALRSLGSVGVRIQ